MRPKLSKIRGKLRCPRQHLGYHKPFGNDAPLASIPVGPDAFAGPRGLRRQRVFVVRQAFGALARFVRFPARISIALLLAAAIVLPAQAAGGKYAAIVVDANTGKTLFGANEDARRFPASLTKMMTLYMVFEGMAAGRFGKSTPVRFSAHAASMPPTKLGVKAGGSVPMEVIIYALVTRSANDAAAAVAEFLGGSEAEFARMMTAKARKLGMRNTVFRNASGLPDPGQFTTARDMSTLGIALREHFPQYYAYFSTRSFTFGRQRMGNHNKLLGRVEGVDGIKTGYTRASGFNLVSSVKIDGRKVVAVVMGGESGGARDRHMAELRGTLVARSDAATPGIGDAAATARADAGPVTVALPKKNAPTPDTRPDAVADLASAATSRIEQAFAQSQPRPAAGAVERKSPDVDPVKTASIPSGWAIQVAAAQSESDARKQLAATSRQAPAILADAAGYTMAFDKNGVTYFRVRFGGFSSKAEAWNACNALKKKKIACYAVQQ